MISSKTTFSFLFILLFLCLTAKAQHRSVQEIDSMLVAARATLVTNPENTIAISKEAYKKSLENNYAKGQDYGLLLLNFGRFNSRKFDFIIRDIDKLKALATKHSNYEVLTIAVLLEARTV